MDTFSSGEVFDMIHTNDGDDNTTSNISSYRLHISTFESNLPVFSKPEYGQYTVNTGAYPGETFSNFWDPCISACKCDWDCSIHAKKVCSSNNEKSS